MITEKGFSWGLGKDLWACQIHVGLFAAGSKGKWTMSPGLGGIVKELWGEKNSSAPSSQVPHKATKQQSHWGQSQQSNGHGDQSQLGASQHTAQAYWIMMPSPVRIAHRDPHISHWCKWPHEWQTGPRPVICNSACHALQYICSTIAKNSPSLSNDPNRTFPTFPKQLGVFLHMQISQCH